MTSVVKHREIKSGGSTVQSTEERGYEGSEKHSSGSTCCGSYRRRSTGAARKRFPRCREDTFVTTGKSSLWTRNCRVCCWGTKGLSWTSCRLREEETEMRVKLKVWKTPVGLQRDPDRERKAAEALWKLKRCSKSIKLQKMGELILAYKVLYHLIK